VGYYAPLERRGDHFVLPCERLSVARVIVEHAWTLEFEPTPERETWVLRMQGLLSVTAPEGSTVEIDTEADPLEEPALQLQGLRLAEANIWPTGRLELVFSDETVVAMEPEPAYETWSLNTVGAPASDAFVSPIAPNEKDWT
jgi:hypothetical protein